LGVEIFNDEYDGLPIFPTYLMYAYRNAIGDLAAPKYIYWLEKAEEEPYGSWMMIILIWILWVLNQWIIFIILLNFLIAIVGDSYAMANLQKEIHLYENYALLNLEYLAMSNALGTLP
jgi:sensor histidine kinase YesM